MCASGKTALQSAVPLSVSTDGKLCSSYNRRLISKAKVKAIKYSMVIVLGEQHPSMRGSPGWAFRKQTSAGSRGGEPAGRRNVSDWRGMWGTGHSLCVWLLQGVAFAS